MDSISSRSRETLYSDDYGGSHCRLKKTRSLPKDIIDALERGELDEAMRKLELKKREKSHFFSHHPKIKRIINIMILPLPSILKGGKKRAGRKEKVRELRLAQTVTKDLVRTNKKKTIPLLKSERKILLQQKVQKKVMKFAAFPLEVTRKIIKFHRLLFQTTSSVIKSTAHFSVQIAKKAHQIVLPYYNQGRNFIYEKFAPMISAIKEKVHEITGNCTHFIQEKRNVCLHAYQQGIDFIHKKWEPVQEFFQITVEKIKDFFEKEKERVTEVLSKKKQKIENFFQNTWQLIHQVVPPIGFMFQRITYFISKQKGLQRKRFNRFKKFSEKFLKETFSQWRAVRISLYFLESSVRVIKLLISAIVKLLKKIILLVSFSLFWLWKKSIGVFFRLKNYFPVFCKQFKNLLIIFLRKYTFKRPFATLTQGAKAQSRKDSLYR